MNSLFKVFLTIQEIMKENMEVDMEILDKGFEIISFIEVFQE